jgi:hypothetical protein
MADLTTTGAVKAYAGVKASDDDQSIQAIVSAVSVYLHDRVGHDYDGDAITSEHHTTPASGALVLEKPAATIDAVRVGTGTIAASGYELEGERLLYRLASGETVDWARGVRNIEVDYTPTTDVPKDLELAAREVAAFVLKQSSLSGGASRFGLAAQANGDSGSADYFVQALNQLPFAAAILRRYTRFA